FVNVSVAQATAAVVIVSCSFIEVLREILILLRYPRKHPQKPTKASVNAKEHKLPDEHIRNLKLRRTAAPAAARSPLFFELNAYTPPSLKHLSPPTSNVKLGVAKTMDIIAVEDNDASPTTEVSPGCGVENGVDPSSAAAGAGGYSFSTSSSHGSLAAEMRSMQQWIYAPS
ncbi:hypothetical protein Vretimale_10423, partial [Volvox reticuliferus]